MKPQILIAEPDALHAAACRAFLLAEGVEGRMAKTGLDLRASLGENRPDVLVLDLDLPWGSGPGLLDVLHETEVLGEIPILVLTDRPSRLVEAGLCGNGLVLLLRPVSPFTVTTAVVEILHNRLDQAAAACLIVEEERAALWR